MKYQDIKLSITEQFKSTNSVVPYIEGKPGGGKSALASAVGKELGFDNVVQFFASLRDPVDLLGTPRNDDEVTRWIPPAELKRLESGRNRKSKSLHTTLATPSTNQHEVTRNKSSQR